MARRRNRRQRGWRRVIGSKLGFTREEEGYGLLLNSKAVEEDRALLLVSNQSERGVNPPPGVEIGVEEGLLLKLR